jgi:uncharacterized membrane-anchored protein YitT (DUF2179 family)
MKVMTMANRVSVERFFESFKPVVSSIGLIVAGSIIYIIGMKGILVPHGFLSGGIVGLAMLMHYFIPVMGIGLAYFLLNIPLAIIGWTNISRRFMVYSLFGMVFFSLAAATIHPPALDIKDPILAALLSGIICGIGSGLILRSFGSAGGMDILGIYLNKKFGFRIGSIIFVGNAAVLAAGAFFCNIQIALYSMIFLFTCGKVIDSILTGFNRRKALIVISDQAETIAEKILSCKGRGVTFLNGEGAFSKKEKKVIFTITSLTELPKLKEMILALDPDAFMVINDTLEVVGKRHGSGRVY